MLFPPPLAKRWQCPQDGFWASHYDWVATAPDIRNPTLEINIWGFANLSNILRHLQITSAPNDSQPRE
ncbi:hypothetical protein THIOM_002448 [Candidatus Thiomargarita nelsonii]|uniref:Uncharacterized protein n=1 Tax=Candidatus Thiomargarita nelsonii TaxID=1003181 RepID=A0A176S1I6_9GAMM|nr:hypothetical protein THIOM_002448 [Candidatus Thiomargarita nelsonii]